MLSASASGSADNSYLVVDYSGYHKTSSNNCLLVYAHFGLWFELVVKVRRFDVSRLYFEGSYLQHLNIISLSSTSFFSVQLFKAEQVREVLGFSGIAIDTIKLFALQFTAWFQSLQPCNFLFLASVVTVLTIFLFLKWESFSKCKCVRENAP